MIIVVVSLLTDAELAAMVTSPNYKRGTLPIELENHVDELFKKAK